MKLQNKSGICSLSLLNNRSIINFRRLTSSMLGGFPNVTGITAHTQKYIHDTRTERASESFFVPPFQALLWQLKYQISLFVTWF